MPLVITHATVATDPQEPLLGADDWNAEHTISGLDDLLTGPASSTDNAIARFDGTTGKVLQNSSVVIDDSGNLTSFGVAPTIYLGNDSDQYITGNATSNFLSISTANQERMRINSSGNVGIGTPTPSSKLEISSGALTLPVGSVASPSLIFSGYASDGLSNTGSQVHTSITGVSRFAVLSNKVRIGRGQTYSWASGVAADSSDDANLSRLSSAKIGVGNGTNGDYSGTLIAGNVGIGTSSPQTPLHVIGDSRFNTSGVGTAGQVVIDAPSSNGRVYGYNSSTLAFMFHSNGNSFFNGGNLGIGTTTPSQKLDVVAANASGPVDVIRWGGTHSSYTLGSLTTDPISYWSGAINLYQNGVLNTRISANGASYLNGGNVGIGTTSPSTSLHVNGPVRCASYTVATLPLAATVGAGSRAFVTDALSPVFQALVAGGGAVFTPVYSDGANWLVG